MLFIVLTPDELESHSISKMRLVFNPNELENYPPGNLGDITHSCCNDLNADELRSKCLRHPLIENELKRRKIRYANIVVTMI